MCTVGGWGAVTGSTKMKSVPGGRDAGAGAGTVVPVRSVGTIGRDDQSGRSVGAAEDSRTGGDGAVVVALVVQGHPHSDPTAGAGHRLAVHPEGADLPAGQVHDMPGLDLEEVGAD